MNAIEIRGPQSDVNSKNGKVSFEISKQDQKIIFQIQDWGIGIPEAEQKKFQFVAYKCEM